MVDYSRWDRMGDSDGDSDGEAPSTSTGKPRVTTLSGASAVTIGPQGQGGIGVAWCECVTWCDGVTEMVWCDCVAWADLRDGRWGCFMLRLDSSVQPSALLAAIRTAD